jgi:hypothetical protein
VRTPNVEPIAITCRENVAKNILVYPDPPSPSVDFSEMDMPRIRSYSCYPSISILFASRQIMSIAYSDPHLHYF